MQFSPVHTSCSFFTLSNLQNPEVICLLTFGEDNLSGLFLHLFTFSIKDLSTYQISGIDYNILVSSEVITALQKPLFSNTFVIQV